MQYDGKFPVIKTVGDLMNIGWEESGTIANIPELPGIYLILDNSGEYIYAGQSANLKQRLSHHKYRKNLHFVKFHVINEIDEDLLDYLESRSITLLSPPGCKPGKRLPDALKYDSLAMMAYGYELFGRKWKTGMPIWRGTHERIFLDF